MKNKDDYTEELCPNCDEEVRLKHKFKVQQCPNCKCPILPCSICMYETDGTKPSACDSCPLDNKLKDAWIERVMNTVYRDDDQYYDSNLLYLQTLTTFQLSSIYGQWDDNE